MTYPTIKGKLEWACSFREHACAVEIELNKRKEIGSEILDQNISLLRFKQCGYISMFLCFLCNLVPTFFLSLLAYFLVAKISNLRNTYRICEVRRYQR